MKSLLRSRCAVSEVIGVLFILGIIVTTVSLLLVTGLPNINDYQEKTKLLNVEQAFTVLDSRISNNALGESPSQVMQLDTSGGSISLLNDSDYGRMRLIFRMSGTEHMIYNNTIGTVRYELNDEEVGYEGGGVWRKYANGGTIMISPPEFHYNGETLTLPIIRLNGSSSIASGTVTLHATSQNLQTVFYQNTSTNPLFINPVYGSEIIVKIKSRYYKSWAKYFEERTEFHGVVVHDADSEALAYLNPRPPSVRPYEMPLDIIGLNTTNKTPVKSFKFELANATSDLQLNINATKPTGEKLSIDLQKRGGAGTEGGTITISYQNASREELWESDTGEGVIHAIVNDTGTFDLMNVTGNLTYFSNDKSWTWADDPFRPGTYNKSDGPIPITVIIWHYMRLMGPTFTFDYAVTGYSQPKGFTAPGSKIYLEYDTMPPHITYLHIVEHKVDVKLI